MLIIGHRGAKGLSPENTLASFNMALEHNADAIELDVRTTSDKIAVVFHDRKINGSKIALLSLPQLQKINPEIVTLQEALNHLENKTEIIIELKPGCDLSPVLACMDKTIAKTTIASFDFRLLKLAKKALPDQRIAVNENWSGVRATRRARKLNTQYITMNQRWLWSGFIKSVARSGYKLSAYTLDNPKKAKKWAKYGLYAAITDFPNRFKN